MDYQILPMGDVWADGMFNVPTAIVNKYIRLASAYQLKALLVILACGGKATSNEISKATGIAESDLCDLLSFWVEEGVLLENGASDYGIMSSYLGGAEFVVASRLHALVCACTVSCPMISVGAGKLSSFMSDIGMSKCAVSSFGGAREIVDPVVKSSEEIRASLKEASARMKSLAENELERISDMMK